MSKGFPIRNFRGLTN